MKAKGRRLYDNSHKSIFWPSALAVIGALMFFAFTDTRAAISEMQRGKIGREEYENSMREVNTKLDFLIQKAIDRDAVVNIKIPQSKKGEK